MNSISAESIKAYRSRTYRFLPGQRVNTKEEAIEFVNARGFVFFWPIRGITLPSLWTAVAGDRPVADAHDDPGHVTWGWKDSLLGQRAWYYAKVLRKKATMIAWSLAPYFYALSENYGSPEEDYLTLYEQGRLTLEAKQVYEALLDNGPLDAVALRKAAHMTSLESEGRFNRALADLQADFKIIPVGVTDAGAWHYAFSYDIVARHYHDLPDVAHEISEREARLKLTETYLLSVGAAQARDIILLFGWRPINTERALERLVENGLLARGLQLPERKGEWFVLRELL